MKYLKKYEELNKPESGDYVLIKDNSLLHKEFLKNKIGEIISVIIWDRGGKYYKTEYRVSFDVKEKNSMNGYHIWDFSEEDFEHISKNKEDLEVIINSKKYNL